MFVVEVFELSWPVLGDILALWAHLGGSLGPGRGLCWPILGPMLAYFGPKNGSKRRRPKNTQKMTQKRSRQRPAGRPGAPRAASEGPKTDHFWYPQNIGCRHPNMHQKRIDKSIQNPVHAATSEKSRFLGPPWPILGLCWPVLRATLAHLGGSVDAILGHVVENVEIAKSTVNHSISEGSAAPGRARVLLRRRRPAARTRPGSLTG